MRVAAAGASPSVPPRGGEDRHVDSDLGDEVLGGDRGEAGDGAQPVDLVLPGPALPGDPGGDLRDLRGELVDAAEHGLQDPHVVRGEERAVQGLFQFPGLAAGAIAGFSLAAIPQPYDRRHPLVQVRSQLASAAPR